MYRPGERLFAFRLRRRDGDDVLEGTSLRYTAIALLGLAGEPESTAAEVLRGAGRQDVCDRLIADLSRTTKLGDVALVSWAASALKHSGAQAAFARLRELEPLAGHHPTVERAWALTALSVGRDESPDHSLAEQLARQLMDSFGRESAVFPHNTNGTAARSWRSHVACFADLVYPVQALAHFGMASGHAEALEIAHSCADHMCRMQGPEGQWWWHFDYRTGRVIESYPVYAVHQDAMAPMALFSVERACGVDYRAAVERGLQWLMEPSEITQSLIDQEAGVIWRKVGRREPGKLSRVAQAAVSAVNHRWRVPGLNALFRPDRIDFESRPYHMGWLLHAWPRDRLR